MNWKKTCMQKINNMDGQSYIPTRFYREISLHIFKNYYANKCRTFKTPLILAISGAPGMGKTYQTGLVLDELGVEKYIISGAEFENESAGVPVKDLQQKYKDVSDDIFYQSVNMGAIIIDDIDAAIGQWNGLVQYTMNRQLLIKTLIDFADNPYILTAYDCDEQLQQYHTNRVPIIVTLNDETKMYEPLMRNGRTTVFPWIPKQQEIFKILESVFLGISMEKSPSILYDQLLSYANIELGLDTDALPISLFSDIRSSLNDEYLWQQLCSQKTFDTIVSDFSKMLNTIQYCKFSDVFDIGKTLLHENKNYLRQK